MFELGLRVAETANSRALLNLTPAEARLGAVFSRPRTAAIVCIVVLTALGWAALALMAGNFAEMIDAICRPAAHATPLGAAVALTFAMWSAMAFAMMLPTAGPMIFTYAEIADTAAQKGERVVSPFVLTAGYAAVWLGFAAIATAIQTLLVQVAPFGIDAADRLFAAAAFGLAGAYQFSSLKQACLAACQRPFPFFFANWTTARAGVFRLGLRQGLHCLGCCWAMMLLMLVAGAMNVVWMAALGVVMTAEKMSATPLLSRIVGGCFLVVGTGFAAAAHFGL